MNHEHAILRTLDNPLRFLFWTLDEFLLMAIPVFVGLLLGWPLLALVGFGMKPVYSRIRRRVPIGTVRHRLYWLLPQGVFRRAGILRSLPPSHIRELLL